MKAKIIYIHSGTPPYEYLCSNDRPDHYWEKQNGGWLGFWSQEWPDQLGESVLKETGKYDWEVWQPDYRADRIYSKTLETGVTHRLFPAKNKSYRLGLRNQNGFFSEAIITSIKDIQKHPIILTLYSTYGLRTPFHVEILKILGPNKNFPIFFRGGGMFKAPISEITRPHKPFTYISLIVEHFRQKKLLQYVDVISEQANSALRQVRKVYNGRIERLTLGCNFDFWVPVPSMELKKSIRDKLNIPPNKTVFFASGNFVPRKQLDKLLAVFNSIQNRDDFFILIAGHGNESNTKLLISLADSLVVKRKALIHPYITGEKLRNLYWASDLYVSVATDEGGPVSVMKAMACGLPVISTSVGQTVETMKKHRAGRFVPVKKYDKWAKAIIEICEQRLPAQIDIKIARDAYHWPNVVRRYIQVYDDLAISRF